MDGGKGERGDSEDCGWFNEDCGDQVMSDLITEISIGASIATAIGTLVLACATFLMSRHAKKSAEESANLAKGTENLAKEAEKENKKTREIIKQNEQYHMDDSRPILAIYSRSGKNLEDQDNRKEIIGCPNVKKISKDIIKLDIDGKIRNIGKGIAKNIKIDIEFAENKRLVIHRGIDPIARDESVELGEVDFYSGLKEDSDFVNGDNKFKESSYDRICNNGYTWIIYLHYEDVYSNKFITKHESQVEKIDESGKFETKIVPWAQFLK